MTMGLVGDKEHFALVSPPELQRIGFEFFMRPDLLLPFNLAGAADLQFRVPTGCGLLIVADFENLPTVG